MRKWGEKPYHSLDYMLRERFGEKVYKTVIPRNVKLSEAPSYGMPITMYDPKSSGADSYRKLADELINRKGA